MLLLSYTFSSIQKTTITDALTEEMLLLSYMFCLFSSTHSRRKCLSYPTRVAVLHQKNMYTYIGTQTDTDADTETDTDTDTCTGTGTGTGTGTSTSTGTGTGTDTDLNRLTPQAQRGRVTERQRDRRMAISYTVRHGTVQYVYSMQSMYIIYCMYSMYDTVCTVCTVCIVQ